MTLHDPTATGAAVGTTSSSVLRGSACASAAGGLAAYRVLSALPRLAGCVLGLLVGGAVFDGLAPVLRCLPPDDAEWLAEMAGERRDGSVARAIPALSPKGL